MPLKFAIRYDHVILPCASPCVEGSIPLQEIFKGCHILKGDSTVGVKAALNMCEYSVCWNTKQNMVAYQTLDKCCNCGTTKGKNNLEQFHAQIFKSRKFHWLCFKTSISCLEGLVCLS